MEQIIGWIIWGIITLWAIILVLASRASAKLGQTLQPAAGATILFLWIIVVLFCLFDWNKLHILWLAPLSFFTAHFLAARRLPVLSPMISSISRFFLSVVFMGIERKDLVGVELIHINKHDSASQPGGPDLIELTKDLLKSRYSYYPADFASTRINNMSKEVIMGIPEATIVTIIEAYSEYKKQGLSDQDIFQKIQTQRTPSAEADVMPSELTLSSYIKYRMKLEHPDSSAQLSDQFIDEAIEKVKKVFQ